MKLAKQYVGAANLKAAVAKAIKGAESWRTLVQATGVGCLNHAREHGDWTILRDLVVGVTKTEGVNKTKLRLWAQQYMNAELVEADDGTEKFIFAEGMGPRDIDVEGAAGASWWEQKPPKRDTTKTLEEIRDAVFKQLVRSAKAGKVSEEEGKDILDTIDRLLEERATMAELMETRKAA